MAKVSLDKSRYPVLGPLVWQLRFVPPQTLLAQSYRAERLVRLIDPYKHYPYDFICFKLTDYKPKEPVEIEPIAGAELIADLAQFVADVSSQAPESVHQLPEPAFPVTELADRAGVSVKTVRRWRRLGLAQRSVICDDGVRRDVVARSTWQWFVDRNEKRVARAAAYSRLNAGQRRWVVREARKLYSRQGLNRHQIEKLLAAQTGRVPETIRYILKRHDATAGIEERIFPLRRKINEQDKIEMWEQFRQGVAIGQLARAYGRSCSSIYRLIQEARVHYWFGRKIDYIYSPEFDIPNAAETIVSAAQFEIKVKPGTKGQFEVLTPAQERAMFRAYNYVKWRQSETIKTYQSARAVPAHVLDELDELEAAARSIRSKLTLANQALIISIAKRHLDYALTLDELVSEGMGPLLKSIEKFDYTKGYKFSTYASWAIIRHYARVVSSDGERHRQYVSLSQEELDLLLPGTTDVDEADAFRRSRAVQRALEQLDERERNVLTNRFSLDRTGEPLSLAQLGKILGVSKERVRQIELHAMEKMHGILETELQTEKT